ncbi:MAG: LysM peptidoglycan-binding domain-containing protein [Planctomycetaceae bacterium]|nr:LysM peptidoglycan-binding domain-containing protein [Planctomycetaceae bacterium]
MTPKNSDVPARRAPGEPQGTTDAQDADWGFASGKKERTLDPRLGLVLVSCLLLMFGFVLYQKYQSIRTHGGDLLAEQSESNADQADDPDTNASSAGIHQTSSTESLTKTAAAQVSGSTTDSWDAESRSAHGAEPTPTFADAGWGTKSVSPPTTVATANAAPPPQNEPNVFGDWADQVESKGPAENRSSEGAFFDDPSPAANGADAGSFAYNPEPDNQNLNSFSDSGWGTPAPHETHVAQGPDVNADAFDSPPSPRAYADTTPASQQTQNEPQAFDFSGFAGSEASTPDPFAQAAGPRPPSEGAQDVSELETDLDAGWGSLETAQTADSGWSTSDGQATASTLLSAPSLPPLDSPSASTVDASDGEWNLSATPEATSSPDANEPGLLFAPDSAPGPAPPYAPPQSSWGASQDLAETATWSSQGRPERVIGEGYVTVTRRHSLWSITQEAYGTARYLSALARYNQDRVPNPDKLPLGVNIRIPAPETLEMQFPDLFSQVRQRDSLVTLTSGGASSTGTGVHPGLFLDPTGRPHYRVDKSDTLTRIAQRHLGKSSRWTEILAMNQDRLKTPETLKPGMILRMPADAGAVAVSSPESMNR